MGIEHIVWTRVVANTFICNLSTHCYVNILNELLTGLSSLLRYILAEVNHGYLLEEDERMYSDKQRRVSTFMKTPRELEKVINLYVCCCILIVLPFITRISIGLNSQVEVSSGISLFQGYNLCISISFTTISNLSTIDYFHQYFIVFVWSNF